MSVAAGVSRRTGRMGCLMRAAGVVLAAFALIVAIGLIFDQGDDAKQPQRGYNAGPAEEFPRGDINYLEAEHLYVTRLQDGTFVALYDKSPKQQEIKSDCRVSYDETAGLGTLEQLPGFKGGLVEECGDTRAVWRADGERAFGAGYGDLDRFQTAVDGAGNLIVKTNQRTCTKSRGVAGVPPFVETTCNGKPD